MDNEAFQQAMEELGLPDREWKGGIAVAVSGGADSMALAVLTAEWARRIGIRMLALTCDHGLRPEASTETQGVNSLMTSMGVQCRIIRLGMEAGSGVQNRARDARYAAMLHEMRKEGIGVLSIGHHRLDQAETVQHRLETGAAFPSALAGMLPVRVAADALAVRPLLRSDPDDLRQYLRLKGISWFEDPSNRDPHYTRVRIRKELDGDRIRVAELLNIADINASHLADIRMGAKTLLESIGAESHPGGATRLDLGSLGRSAEAAEAVRSIVIQASGHFSATPDAAFLAFAEKGGGTLCGTAAWKQGRHLWIAREASRMEAASAALPWSLWDGRLRLGASVPGRCLASSLGDSDATSLRSKRGLTLPHRVLSTVPCLRRDGRIVAVPDLAIGEKVNILQALRKMPHLTKKQLCGTSVETNRQTADCYDPETLRPSHTLG